MSLIKCSECGKEISDKATSCPNCGAQIAFANSNPIEAPVPVFNGTNNVPAPKKKHGCLISFIFLFLFATGLGASLMYALKEHPEAFSSSTTTSSEEDNEASYLEFDEQSWEQFASLYKAHNTFMEAIDSYSKNQVSSLDFYDYCKKVKKYFQEVSINFNYGKTKDEKTYLSVLQNIATSDQLVAEYLMDYVDSGKTSKLSSAQTYIENAKEAILMVAENRVTLLKNAGLSNDEIKKKIEKDTKKLEE